LIYRVLVVPLYSEGEGFTGLESLQYGREGLQYGYAACVDREQSEAEDFYTVDEAARILRLTPGRIRQMLRAGELEGL
jgi:hypothetical protein